MAGDWLKMRSNLWDDPRVGRIMDMTDSSEGPVIGALYWLWATADQHTEDGHMPGMSLRQIDRKTGLPGFGAALVQVGWLVEADGGVTIQRFEEHNGASAKRRCTDAQRKAKTRNVSASDADNPRTDDGRAEDEKRRSSELEKEKRREEIEDTEDLGRATCAAREDAHEPDLTGQQPTQAGLVCRAMKGVGFAMVNPGDAVFVELLRQGATEPEFVESAQAALAAMPPKGWGWVLKRVQSRRAEAAAINLAPQTQRPMSRNDERAAKLALLTGRNRHHDHQHDAQPTGDVVDIAARVVG